MSKNGITNGDTVFDLATVDGQLCYVRLTGYGLVHNLGYTEPYAITLAMGILESVCFLVSLPVLIDHDSATGILYSVAVDNVPNMG